MDYRQLFSDDEVGQEFLDRFDEAVKHMSEGLWVPDGSGPEAIVERFKRIFDGVYNCKRLAAGQLTAVEGRDVVHHDATTLGGNSGSAVIDLDSGKAVALHFGGAAGRSNVAVHAAAVARIVRAHG